VDPRLATWLPTLVFVPLVGFALYRRVKNTFGKQRLAPKRMLFRMAMLTLVGVLLLVTWLPTPTGFVAALAGVTLGAGLAAVGLAHTKFEVVNGETFYVPNKWIGLVLTALLLGRLAGRFMTLSERMNVPPSAPLESMQRSPFTLGLFFLLAGYYVAYYGGVLKRARGASAPPK
jgi:hypothetical protein